MKAAVTLVWAGIIALAIPAVAMAERGIQVVPKGSTALQERRTALVIGNGAYADAPLRNPANDAADMAATLEKLGFEVTRLIDAFGRKLPQSGIGLLYFAGRSCVPKQVLISLKNEKTERLVNSALGLLYEFEISSF